MTAATGIGARVKRKEDQRFLTGTGRYVDDLPLARATYAYFLRSPHAHARIRSINVDAAKAAPGVVAVYTGHDVKADGLHVIETVEGLSFEELQRLTGVPLKRLATAA